MPGPRSYQEMIDARRAQMTPEQRDHFDGYQDGFKNAYETWNFEIMNSSIYQLLRLRRELRKVGRKKDDG